MRFERMPRILACVSAVFFFSCFFFAAAAPAASTFTILHTNDFHGQLVPSGSNPGAARLANIINTARIAAGDANTLFVDAGDSMQGSLLSNMLQGEPVIDVFNTLGCDVATFGNHDFDWGQDVLSTRTAQATYPFVTANIVKNDTGSCETAGWAHPDFADGPYHIIEVGSPPVKVAFIGVTTRETPSLEPPGLTNGLCFKDPASSIVYYYDQMKADGAQVIVVLSHLGNTDGGYGYGFPVYGDKTLAGNLVAAGKPADLIIGGHSHTDLDPQVVQGVGIVQAHYNGRKVGKATISVDNASVTTAWERLSVSTSGAEDTTIKDLVANYSADPEYLADVNEIIGYTQVKLVRDYNGDNMMGDFIDDAIYDSLNNDGTTANDVDMFFNNPGGLRDDITFPDNTTEPFKITYGLLYGVLPFGNQAIVGSMTGAQIYELLNQSATLFKGALQCSGIRYSFYRYTDTKPGPQPWAWGAYDIEVFDKGTASWMPLDPNKSYRVGTNEFLAPAGQDGFTPFKYMTGITYWGDMLDWVIKNLKARNETPEPVYNGPDNSGVLDGRIKRCGTDTGGDIVPLTILHHNDSHGNMLKGTYAGYTQLATLITQERAHNPDRSLLLHAGDMIQGDAFLYYFRTAYSGNAADNETLTPELSINPAIAAFNAMNYDAVTLGNHEYNFGRDVLINTFKQATFPVLQANVADDGSYGLAEVPINQYAIKTMGTEGIKVAIIGMGNHRVPNYELPTNIVGLSFTNPIEKMQELASSLRSGNDVILGLTHIGFTANPGSVEVDSAVDSSMAATVTGIDAIIGGHSHTDPSKKTTGSGDYQYLPALVGGPGNTPVIVSQAYRYNTYLGEIVLGLRSKEGGYEVVSRAGRYIPVATATAEDSAIKTLLAPYNTFFADYQSGVIGKTLAPLDTLQAYTQETNGANLQADAAVWTLENSALFPVDIYLGGAMANKMIASTATPASPADITIANMFTFMPYENYFVLLSMNGPQLKEVLERAYRNYYYYKYVPDHGMYSYYTTCMLMPDSCGQITYFDGYPSLPTGHNVAGLTINGQSVDFDNATTYYNVATLNYLAAGSCNYNNAGVSVWPTDQILHDTQLYQRDAVIEYIRDKATIEPAIEGRLQFTTIEPTTTSTSVAATTSTSTTVFSSSTTTSVKSKCPFVKTLNSERSGLTGLYRLFRDSRLSRSDKGRQLIAGYYGNAEELSAIIAQSPQLEQRTRALILSCAPELFSALHRNQELRFTGRQYEKALELLDRIDKSASPGLSAVLQKLQAELKDGSLQRELGFKTAGD